jgi:hypothetical protein
MFCQECGAQIRSTARFCNKCGATVKQRFDNVSVARPETVEPPAPEKNEAPKESPMVIPFATEKAPRVRRAEQRAIFEPVSSDASAKTSRSPAQQAGHNRAERKTREKPAPRSALEKSSDAAPQSFFTQVMPATVNRRHNRLVVVAAVLLLAFVALALLFYYAAKFA